MVVTKEKIKEEYSNYKNVDTKITREIANGKLIKLKNGLYETDKNAKGIYLAGSIYGPSYISFEYALYYYDLIPERVTWFTSATCNKNRTKIFDNDFGRFSYQDIPSRVYPLGVNLIFENGYAFQIASREKAICDKLYTIRPVSNIKEMEELLLDDLRIDEDELDKLNYDDIELIAKYYHSTNVTFFQKYMKRRLGNEYSY